jgi:hypothetical protein
VKKKNISSPTACSFSENGISWLNILTNKKIIMNHIEKLSLEGEFSE